MRSRVWLWVGTALNVVLLWPGFYMAIAAAQLARENPDSGMAVAIAVLFFALPVFCIAAILAAWRASSRTERRGNAGALLAAPLVYAAFLTAFLLRRG
jgi:uncharacterized membrane protein YozB (DUF420 family)